MSDVDDGDGLLMKGVSTRASALYRALKALQGPSGPSVTQRRSHFIVKVQNILRVWYAMKMLYVYRELLCIIIFRTPVNQTTVLVPC